MNVFRKLSAYLQLREAMLKADKEHQKSGARYYVLPMQTTDGKPKLIIMDRKNFRLLKRKHYISRNVKMNDLMAESFYFTPGSNEKETLTEEVRKQKRNQFFEWFQSNYSCPRVRLG